MNDQPPTKNKIVSVIENAIFGVKWLLPLFYLGLTIILVLYGWAYARHIADIAVHHVNCSIDDMKVIALDAIDIVMVANLVKMIISGSYNSFVSKGHGRANENISSGMLKVKIATSIVVVASIHLLRLFISTEPISVDEMHRCVVIYILFLSTATVLGGLEFLHEVSERNKHDR